ncbi:hypothetical protein P4S72_21805 [Vibrio sp. PP-XX7]
MPGLRAQKGRHGLRIGYGASVVLLLDERSTAGGQIYRSIKENGHPLGQVLGPTFTGKSFSQKISTSRFGVESAR